MSEAVTVAWMLAALCALVAQIGSLAAWAAGEWFAGERVPFQPLRSLPGLLLLIALASGLVCLLLTWPALRLRRGPVPRPVTVAALLIGAAPWALLLLLAWLESR